MDKSLKSHLNAHGSYMGIGWVIQAIRGEVEEAEKQPSLYKEWEKDK